MIIFIACLTASMLFGILYRYDNKYNTNAQIFQDGTVVLPDVEKENGTQSEEVIWLVNGWEICPDRLIYPGDLAEEWKTTYIGQYFSFAGFHGDGSPYGVGTYRLTISGNGNYTMLIPEVFSACAVYVNGEQTASSGSVSPYRPYIKDLVFSFEINGDAE